MPTPNRDSSAIIQKCLKAILEDITDVTGVYDNVPEDAVYPYVTFGNITALSNATKCIRLFEYTVTLHVWSRSNGTIQTRNIISDIVAALDNVTLQDSDYAPACYFLSSTVMKDPDNITNHGVVRFEIRD